MRTIASTTAQWGLSVGSPASVWARLRRWITSSRRGRGRGLGGGQPLGDVFEDLTVADYRGSGIAVGGLMHAVEEVVHRREAAGETEQILLVRLPRGGLSAVQLREFYHPQLIERPRDVSVLKVEELKVVQAPELPDLRRVREV